MADLFEIWQQAYQIVPKQLLKVQEVQRVVTAFNTNIDAVVKISGARLSALAAEVGITATDLNNLATRLQTPKDAVRGIIKCFVNGIAEEWLCEDKTIDDWMNNHLGYDRLQMGGQAGIVANVLAVLGANEVVAHTSSHPQQQAEQFLNLPNLYAVDANGKTNQARVINRVGDEPLVHRIIEFDKDEVLELENVKYVCPKANRFIATYDTANIKLKINDGFVQFVNDNGFDFMILSGFHNLTAERDGIGRIDATVPLLQQWKNKNQCGIIHLELASTQDKTVRSAIINKIAPMVDSVGLNEREALEVLEVIKPEMFAEINGKKLTATCLYEILKVLKNALQTPRIQLHFFGMYLTLQNHDFAITAEANKRGMMLAATVAASKAGLGNVEQKANLLWAHGFNIGTEAVDNVQELANYLHSPQLAVSGILQSDNMDLIAVPTIIVNKPKTLVGMGDTISSVSLVGAR